MPARGRTPREPPPSPGPSFLNNPQPQAESDLTERIEVGRELAATKIPGLDAAAPAGMVFPGGLNAPYGSRRNRNLELDVLRRRVSQWRDYNQTWLDTNLGGEAAQEYKSASTH